MFYESSQINNILNCAKCNERLDVPKILPCGATLCLFCVGSLPIIDYKFKCSLCSEIHHLPATGFPTCKTLLNLLTIQPEEIHRSDAVDALNKSLNEIQKKLLTFKHSIINGIDIIKEYCIDLRIEVQLATELATQQINQYSEEILETINKYESECLNAYEVNKSKIVGFNNIANEAERFHEEWTSYLKRFKISDQLILDANESACRLNQLVDEEKLKLDDLIFNENILKFERNTTKLSENILGGFVTSSLLMNSAIITNKESKNLMQLCGFVTSQKWRLLYRASENGFSANSFHSKCDGKRNTLVIIKSANQNIFGGYTQQDWSHIEEGYKTDFDAFIFSLINNDNKPLVMKCTEPHFAILARNGYGPVFGNGGDIHISPNSNTDNSGYSGLGCSYKHPQYVDMSHEARSFLAGSPYFQIIDIEVYCKY